MTTSEIPTWAQPLGAELIARLTEVSPAVLSDDIAREEHSIRLRRAALRSHSHPARWREIAAAAGVPAPAEPTVTVVLCTKRPGQVSFALEQISRQRQVEHEVVLVLHGVPSDEPCVRQATASFSGALTTVEAGEHMSFGAALNAGVAAASGDYIAKLDDDDWYGPEFLADLLLASMYSGADVVGCLAQYIYLEEINQTIHRPGPEPERYSPRVSGGSLLTQRSTITGVGGFPPIARHVDTGLLRAIRAESGSIYRTHGMGYMVHRRPVGHTWHEPVTFFLRQAARQWRGFRPGALLEVSRGHQTEHRE